VLSTKQQQRAELVDTNWQLMRSGETNASACRVLGMSRRSGTTIRRAHQYQTRVLVPPVVCAVVFVDGLRLLSLSWDRCAKLFEDNGYVAFTSGWPDDPETVEESAEHPEVFAGKSIGQVADHFETASRRSSATPLAGC
jgi:hypothetical protein